VPAQFIPAELQSLFGTCISSEATHSLRETFALDAQFGLIEDLAESTV